MTDMQTAILWWRQLYSELGLSGVGSTPGRLGEMAQHRHKSLIDLFFALNKELDIGTFLEIGAHEAGASKHFVWLNPNGRAYAYEPAPAVYKKTVESGIPDRMQIFPIAVGPKAGDVTFFQPVDERFHPMASSRKRLGGETMEVEEVRVPVITLETVASRAVPAPGRRTTMWVDVEGQAFEVLRSGEAFIRDRVAMVYIEVQDFNSYEGGATSLEVIDILLRNGFVPVSRDNQHADAWNLLMLHQDCYLAARESIAYWLRSNAGIAGVANWLTDGKFGEPTL